MQKPNILRHYRFNGHINTAEQRTIIQQYVDCYTDRRWASSRGLGRLRLQCTNFILFTSDKEEVNVFPVLVCLSVCLRLSVCLSVCFSAC